MHPALALALDPAALRAARLSPANDDDRALARSLADHPREAAVLAQGEGETPYDDDQLHAAMAVGVYAALHRLEGSEPLGSAISSAKGALLAAGTSPAEAKQLLGLTVLDEAFAFEAVESDPQFKQELVLDTVRALPKLASLSDELVEMLFQTFSHQATPDLRAIRYGAAEALLQIAWADGPQPITPEHLGLALERMLDEGARDVEQAEEVLASLIDFLHQQGLFGEVRQALLQEALALIGLALEDGGALPDDASAEGDESYTAPGLEEDDGDEDLPESDDDDLPPPAAAAPAPVASPPSVLTATQAARWGSALRVPGVADPRPPPAPAKPGRPLRAVPGPGLKPPSGARPLAMARKPSAPPAPVARPKSPAPREAPTGKLPPDDGEPD
ncbi:MAG: hypothetical protein K1X89_23885 [Myxococcaceae bacterium]|nr:hypothetical protein [Myxococcaceae bacterium]